MKQGNPHIQPESHDLARRVSTYEEQLADTNERLCSAEDALERERLLREDIIRAEVARRLKEIESGARAAAVEQVRAELAEAKAEAKSEMEAAKEELLRDRKKLEGEKTKLEERKADVDRVLKEGLEKMAAQSRELSANVRKIKEDAVMEYRNSCGDIQGRMIEMFIKSLKELPGATRPKREKILDEYKAVSEESMTAIGNEVKKQIAAVAAESKKKTRHIEWLANQMFGRKSERACYTQESWEAMEKKWLEDQLLPDAELTAFRKAISEHKKAIARLREMEREKSESGHGKTKIPPSVPISSIVTLTPKEVTENPGKYERLRVSETSTLHKHTKYTRSVVRRETYVLIDPLANPELKEIVSAELPDEYIPEGKYANSVRTDVIVSKYVDHIPLARQEKMSERDGCRINRSTMNDFINECAESYLKPLFPLLESEVLKSKLIAADGVPMKVVDNEKSRTVSRYVVAIRSIDTGAVIFKSYVNTDDDKAKKKRSGRDKGVLQSYLKDWTGIAIMCDAYPGYDWLAEEGKIICRCSAHSRRDFFDAGRENEKMAQEGIMHFQMIYAVEDYIQNALETGEMEVDEVCKYRHTFAEPSWVHLKAWCAQVLLTAPDGTLLKKACKYLLNHYDELTNYLDIPQMPLDNNGTERVIRNLVMGRKNYLFNQSEESLARDTIIYSFLATCAVMKVNPQRWLESVMDNFDSTPEDKLYTLLPQHWHDVDAPPAQ